jgi:hypothetical protein
MCSILSLALPDVSVLRALRAIRPIRVIIRSDNIKVVVQALFHAIPAIGNVFVFCMLFWLIFGILGVNLFGRQCVCVCVCICERVCICTYECICVYVCR